MEENIVSQFEKFEKKEGNRRALLPVWIKAFCWIFMFAGAVSLIVLFFGIFGKNSDLSLYGFETNEPLSWIGISIIAAMFLKGFTAYSLWFERDNAIQLGKIDAILGILLCVISMILIPIFVENASVTLRLELVLLIPYYYKLENIKNAW